MTAPPHEKDLCHSEEVAMVLLTQAQLLFLSCYTWSGPPGRPLFVFSQAIFSAWAASTMLLYESVHAPNGVF